MKIACIIPSRYASTRLPGKPLRMIAGETLVHRVYERAVLAKLPDIVIVATDNEKIESEVKSFGGRVMMTSPDHPTGTDRLAEVLRFLITISSSMCREMNPSSILMSLTALPRCSLKEMTLT